MLQLRSFVRVTASTLLVVFLSALLGPLAAWARLAGSQQDHLHLPGMPQAHHHHLEDHTRADACARQPLKRPAARHAHAGSGEQQLTSVAPLLQKLVSSAALVPATYLLAPQLVRPLAWARPATVALVPPGHLPPKIPDLRIFLGSLLI